MELFAQESFWKPPSFWDLAGFLIGLSSIWLAWYFAKRDLRQRIDEAKREAKAESEQMFRIIIRGQLRSNIEEVIHVLDLCEESRKGEAFDRSSEFAFTASKRLVRIKHNFEKSEEKRLIIAVCQENIRVVVAALQKKSRKKKGRLQEHEIDKFQDTIQKLIQLASELEGQPEETVHEN